MKAQTSTVDTEEVERFSALAEEWWDLRGKFAPLHRMNPLRIQWILDQVVKQDVEMWRYGDEEKQKISPVPHIPTSPHPLKGIRLLDIGCGGGLIAEPMARLGAQVTAIDASQKNIAVAKLHAEQSGLEIDYRCTTAEDLAGSLVMSHESWDKKTHDQGPMTYDIVLALEIIEHVADVGAFAAASTALLKPGGLIIYSTLNRTLKSFALAIVGAEYVLRWLPRGTHSFEKFLRPSELCAYLRHNNIEVSELTGMVFNPLNGQWLLDKKDLGVNYLMAGRKEG